MYQEVYVDLIEIRPMGLVKDFAVSHMESIESESQSVHHTELTDYHYYVDMDQW
jgi:hypothetical protein